MRGVAAFRIIDCLLMRRVLATGTSRFASPRVRQVSSPAWLTNVTELSVTRRPYAPNMALLYAGGGVGIEALGSPMMAAAITPDFSTNSGFTPKKGGSQMQRSASLSISTEPT